MNRLWVYTIAYNEAHFVKNFLTAYKNAEKIIVYDNQSTDSTVRLLLEDPRVEVREYNSGGQIRDDLYLEIKNNCWKEARGKADWVIVCDFDEIVTWALPPNTFYLAFCAELSYHDLVIPFGYMVYAENMPLFQDNIILDSSIKAVYDKNSEKPCCFRPDRVKEINFNPGCHTANPVPEGEPLAIAHVQEFKLIHFKFINIVHYFDRLADYKKRMSEYNLKTGFGVHYTWTFEQHREIYLKGLFDAKPLFEIEKP